MSYLKDQQRELASVGVSSEIGTSAGLRLFLYAPEIRSAYYERLLYVHRVDVPLGEDAGAVVDHHARELNSGHSCTCGICKWRTSCSMEHYGG